MSASAVNPMADRLSGPLVNSLLLHTLVVGLLLAWAWWNARGRERWGDPASLGGGSVAVQAVNQIPLPARRGPVNPVANDTESDVPAQSKQQKTERQTSDDRDAVALKLEREKKRQAEVAASNQRYRPQEAKDNQLYSTTGQRAVSPMFGVPGSGGVGTGSSSPFGARFGYYEALLRERVARNWRTQDVPAQIKILPVAIVTFVIERNGTIRNVRTVQSSGNYTLDASAQRALYDSAPFPPLPPQFERDSANIEFWFELKR